MGPDDTTIRWRDALLPAGFAACAVTEFAVAGYGWLGAYLLAAGLLVLRRRYPDWMPIAVAAVAATSALLGGRAAFLDAASWLLPPALACFAAGQYTRRVWLSLGGVVAAMAAMYLTLVHLAGFSADVLFGLIVYLGPWACGVALGVALRRAALQAASAERERLLRERAEETGAIAERLRIAQDLHDNLAHSLTAMVVQADLADDLLDGDPLAAREALDRVRSKGREVLTEAARVIRAARHGEAQNSIRALVGEARSLGLSVDIDEPLSEVPPELLGVATAVVREGLTNALRHCAARRVRLSCVTDAADLTLLLANTDEPEPGGGAPEGRSTGTVPAAAGGGLGLVGIRERVHARGGVVEIAHRPTFALSVRLPLSEAR